MRTRPRSSPPLAGRMTAVVPVVMRPSSAEVTSAVEAARALSPDRTFSLEVPDDEVLIEGDADRLHQVLANLLDNAQKSSPAVEPIEVQLVANDGHADACAGAPIHAFSRTGSRTSATVSSMVFSPRYSFWYGAGVNVSGDSTTVDQFPGSSTANTPCNVTIAPASGGFTVAATSAGFTAGANGNIDGDAGCDHWFINDRRNLQNTNTDVTM